MAIISLSIEVDKKGAIVGVNSFREELEKTKKEANVFTVAFQKLGKGLVGFAKNAALIASRIASMVGPTVASTIAARALRKEFEKNQNTMEKNISLWGRFKSVVVKTNEKIIQSIKGFIGSVFSLKGAITTIAGSAGVGLLVKSFIGASSKVEDFKTRLFSLTKSEELATQKLKILSNFASKAPFELPDIIEAGITLEAFGARVKNTIKPLGDLAAFMGVGIVEASRSFGRAFAAGAGAADVLRERGVLAMVKLRTKIDDLSKLSLPQFRKALLATIIDPAGKISGATNRLAKTFTGQMSMMADAVFNLKSTIGEALSPAIKNLVQKRIIPLVKRFTIWAETNKKIIGQQFDKIVQTTADAIEDLVKFVGRVAVGTKEWWERNKETVILLGKLFIAVTIAKNAIVLFLKVLVISKLISFAASIGVVTAAIKGLTVAGIPIAILLLKTGILTLGVAVAGLVGIKVGIWISEWRAGLKEVKKTTMQLSENAARLKKQFSEKLAKLDLGVINLEEFNAAVAEGIIVYDKVAEKWKQVNIDVGESVQAMTETSTASVNEIKEAFESLGVLTKETFDNKVNKAFEGFKLAARSLKDGTVSDFGALKKGLIKQLNELDEEFGKKRFEGLTTGFKEAQTKIVKILDENDEIIGLKTKETFDKVSSEIAKSAQENARGLFDIVDAAGGEVARAGDTTTVVLFKQKASAEKVIREMGALIKTKLPEATLTSEQKMTKSVGEETGKRLMLYQNFAKESVFSVSQAINDIISGEEIYTLTTVRENQSRLNSYRETFDKIKNMAISVNQTLNNVQGSFGNFNRVTVPTFGGVGGGFQKGTPSVPFTGNFKLHRNEAVIPANQNPFNQTVNNTTNNFDFSGTNVNDNMGMKRNMRRASQALGATN